MNGERWRFIDAGPGSGAWNMAVDEGMLEAQAAGEASPALRVYTWRPPAVSLGRFQRAECSVDLAACQRRGLDVVRRPTGGRAILHTEEEVTFSIVVRAERLGTAGVMASYRALAQGIAAGLGRLGVEARLVERAAADGPTGRKQDPACFAVKARCDLVVGSAKMVGSAQVQRNGVILQQNSLPLRMRVEDWREVFLRPEGAPAAVGLWEAAGGEIGYRQVAAALREGFADALGAQFGEGELTERELERARALAGKASLV